MRPRPTALALALLAATAAAAGTACRGDLGTDTVTATTGGGAPESGTVVSGDGWRGVVLGAGVDHVLLPDGRAVEGADGFVPTEDDVRRFEDQVPALLPGAGGNPPAEPVTEAELAAHVRQYTGVEGAGERQLVVAGICESQAADMEWESSWITVADGGTCFWDATMDLATGEVLQFAFHGSA